MEKPLIPQELSYDEVEYDGPKPLPEYLTIIISEAPELTAIFNRMSSRFVFWHEGIKYTSLGKRLRRYWGFGTALGTMLWRMWKASSHADEPITDSMIADELVLFMGEERLKEEIREAGPLSWEEYCERVHYFFSVAKKEYYSGPICCIHRMKKKFFKSKISSKKSDQDSKSCHLTY